MVPWDSPLLSYPLETWISSQTPSTRLVLTIKYVLLSKNVKPLGVISSWNHDPGGLGCDLDLDNINTKILSKNPAHQLSLYDFVHRFYTPPY